MAHGNNEHTRMGPPWAWVLLVLWVAFIWGHSLMAGAESDAESLSIVAYLQGCFEALGVTDLSMMNHLVRKTAHFSEYLVLALLAVNVLRPRLRPAAERVGALLAIWAAVPAIDETIQRFVPGRAGQIRDVLLDMCGFATGVALCGIVTARHKRANL